MTADVPQGAVNEEKDEEMREPVGPDALQEEAKKEGDVDEEGGAEEEGEEEDGSDDSDSDSDDEEEEEEDEDDVDAQAEAFAKSLGDQLLAQIGAAFGQPSEAAAPPTTNGISQCVPPIRTLLRLGRYTY
jgi:hypothetical protein